MTKKFFALAALMVATAYFAEGQDSKHYFMVSGLVAPSFLSSETILREDSFEDKYVKNTGLGFSLGYSYSISGGVDIQTDLAYLYKDGIERGELDDRDDPLPSDEIQLEFQRLSAGIGVHLKNKIISDFNVGLIYGRPIITRTYRDPGVQAVVSAFGLYLGLSKFFEINPDRIIKIEVRSDFYGMGNDAISAGDIEFIYGVSTSARISYIFNL